MSKLFFFFGGYLAEVEVHGEDEHGELGGGGGGGIVLDGGGYLPGSLKLSSYILRILKSRFVSFSLSVLKFVVLGDGG